MELSASVTFIVHTIMTITAVSLVTYSAELSEPKIYLRSYRPIGSAASILSQKEFQQNDQFANQFISRNGSEYTTTCTDVSFTCKSTYPVKWRLPFPEQYLKTEHFATAVISYRMSQLSEHGSVRTNEHQQIILLLATQADSVRLNITCETVDGSHSTSINLFKNGSKQLEILAASSLEKFQSRSLLSGGGIVRVDQESRGIFTMNRFICCSGVQNRLPTLIIEYCATATDCEIVKDTFISKIRLAKEKQLTLHNLVKFTKNPENAQGCVQTTILLSSLLISCQDANVDYFEHLIAALPSENTTGTGVNENTYLPFDTLPRLSVSQKMSISIVGPKSARHRESYSTNVPLWGIQKDTTKLTRLFDYEDQLYQGESVHVLCRGLKLLYSKGAWIRVNWKNGTKTVLPSTSTVDKTAHDDVLIFSKRDIGQSRSDAVHKAFAKLPALNLEIDSVDCYMPLWNNDAWDVLNHKIHVLWSSPPKFAAREEVVRFRDGEKNKQISFEMQEFSPLPSYLIMGCGKHMKIGSKGNSDIVVSIPALEAHENITTPQGKLETLSITISFSTVTKAVECDYQCIAGNSAGKANQKIKVIVAEA